MDTALKKHLHQLLEADKLLEVVQILLSDKVDLPAADYQRLQKLKQEGDLVFLEGEARGQLADYLRQLIETLTSEEAPPPAGSPPAPAPQPPRSAQPRKGGGLLERTWDRLSDVFSSGSSGSSPKGSEIFREEDFDRRPPSPRMPSRFPKKGSKPPKKVPKATPKAAEPPPPPPPPPPTPEATAPVADDPVSNPFQQGKLLYVVPPQMPLEEVSACRIRIAPEQLRDADLQMGLSDEELANAKSEGIRMTQVMRVELLNHPTDADNFRISCRNNLEQPVFPFTVSEWVFDVVPQRPGKYALLIRVTAKVNYAGAERSFDLVVLNRAVEVTAGSGELVELEESVQPIPDNDWDESDVRFVDQALQNNQIARAIERLANFIQDKDRDLHVALLLQQARWNDNSNRLEGGRISTKDWDLMNNQVRYAIAQFHQKIQELDFSRDQSAALAEARKELEK